MSATITDTLQSHLEQVATTIPEYYDFDETLAKQIRPAKWAEATRYLYRIPVVQYLGGTYQKFIADGGDMGSGTGPKMNKLTAGFFDTLLSFQITKEQIDLSATDTQSRINVMSYTLAKAMTVLNAMDNITLFGDGTGKLTNAASTGTSTTLTFASATDYLGVNQLFEGMMVDVWDSTFATKRAGGPYKISAINTKSKQVTFSTAPTAMATTDGISIAGLDIYGPSALTSFSSTWPGGGLTAASGLTGDSFRHGLKYVNDATGTNYYLGVLKSGFPKLMPANYSASATITFGAVELAKNLLIQARGDAALDGMELIMHMCNQAQLKEIGTTISTWMRGPGETGGQAPKMLDVQPAGKYSDTFYVADIPARVSKCCDKSRIDAYSKSHWGRVEAFPTRFYKVGDQMLFPLRSSSTGNLLAGLEFKIEQKMDWCVDDPGMGFYIDSVTPPSGY